MSDTIIPCMQRSRFCVPSDTHLPCECERPIGHDGEHRSGRLRWTYGAEFSDLEHGEAAGA